MPAHLIVYCVTLVLAPAVGALIAGLFGKVIGRTWAHRVTIAGISVSFVIALLFAKWFVIDGLPSVSLLFYHWAVGAGYAFNLGFLIDALSSIMLVVVTFVSLLVHIYSIGYMADDDGYQRFFSYISLFTFAMLMLVTANNFLQLFFGWEGVGLASYLLIGFWFKRESALEGSLKAFLVNRVGDFGFLLGIGLVLAFAGSLDYGQVFSQAKQLSQMTITLFPGHTWSLVTVTCLLLFVGAMGKSAQVPLHVWLPESMEGPTPISALIHAATMVTAGIYMVARMSPLYEYSPVALSTVLIIGATGALFTGLLGIVQNDIKRVVAYSTLSQLGYMMAGVGASAYSAGIFHLVTHACFKAALFLGAGSVIIAMHHKQDMREMGGLRKYMPITYITYVVGSLALCGVPPFAGFYSKDAIIDAIHLSHAYGHTYAYWCVTLGVFVTALYTFRALFMTFHGQPRMDAKTKAHLKESPWVVWLPLVLLAIPSAVLGFIMIKPMLFAEHSLLAKAVFVLPAHNVLHHMAEEYPGVWLSIIYSLKHAPLWLTLAGFLTAWACYLRFPQVPALVVSKVKWLYWILMNKYGFDAFNDRIFVTGSRLLGKVFYRAGDAAVIDGVAVNGSATVVRWFANRVRFVQTGYLYHYALAMALGLVGLLLWLVL